LEKEVEGLKKPKKASAGSGDRWCRAFTQAFRMMRCVIGVGFVV